MNTKLTLRLNADLIQSAKMEARQQGKSVSQIAEEFFETLAAGRRKKPKLPPLTASLLGILKGHGGLESTYRNHLRQKYS